MTILTALLEATLGAWLIAAVIGLIRLCFRRVLSPKAKYYLWALLALRLMLPVLPESPLSLMNFLPQREAAAVAETDAAAAPIADDPVWPETVPEAAPDQAPAIAAPLPEQSVPLQNSVSTPVSEPVPETDHSKLVWQTIVLWIWLGGVGLVLLVYLLLYAITARQLRRLPCVTDPDTLRVFLKLKRDLGIRGKVNLVSGGGGMLGGLLRPTIVIPAELQGQTVAPILVHELLHYKYKDMWVSLMFRVLTAIHWFNPVVWLCFHILRNDSEASCDQRVLESGLVERDRYATVLYEEGVLQMKNSILMQTTFGGDGRSLKRRIRLIAQFRQPKVWMTVLTVVLALVISACTLTGAQSDSPESNQEPSSLEDSSSAIVGNPAKADQLPAGMDMDSYIDAIQPGFGHYGWTFQEHLDAGLLDEDAGEWAYQNEYNSSFTTEIELDGMTLEAEFIFSQTLFTWDTDAPQVLTEVLVTVPSDVVDGIQWGLDLMEPWADYMTIAGNDNAANYCATPVNVGTHLTEGQREIAAQMMVEIGRADSLESARDLLNNWAIARGEYQGNQGVWQFNGTGAALYLTRPADAARTLTIEDICGDSTLDAEAIQTAAEAAMGMDWETYQKKLSDAIEAGDYSDVTLSLEGRPAYFIVHKSPDGTRTRAIRFCLEDDSLDDEAWLSYTEQVTEKLSGLCTEKQSFSTYLFDGGQLHLEFGPVHSEDYEVHEDGTTSYAGIPSELGNRILELRVTFDSSTSSSETAPTLETTISPYDRTTEKMTYTGTNWDMTVSELIAVQELDPEIWEQTSDAQPILHGTSPLPDHPEVTDIYYRFSFKMPQLSMELFRVETHYDPSQISYEALLAQRTAELGEPTDTPNAGGAIWSYGDVQLVIYNDRDGRIQEWLSVWYDRYDPTLLPDCDIDTYLAAVQPPIGRYGWTFQEHVDAGLLDPDKGTLEPINGGTAHAFATQVELGGYTLDAVYCFIETMAGQGSGREVLSEIQVDIPSDLPLSQWLARFSGSWNDRMLHQQNTWQSPMTVGSLLTEVQRDYIAEALVENAVTATMEEAYAYLDTWAFVCGFYDTPRGWVFNGTGAALYTVAQTIQ